MAHLRFHLRLATVMFGAATAATVRANNRCGSCLLRTSLPRWRAPPSTYPRLTTAGSGRLRSASLGLLQVMFRPPSPAIGHPRDREEAPDLLPIEGVDAENIADREIVIGALNDLNLIARADIALDNDAQIGPGAQGLGEAAREELVVHPHPQAPTGHPRLGDLQPRGPDRPALPDEGAVHVDALRRKVLAKLAVGKRSADLLFPPPRVFNRVGVGHFVGPPVCLAIGLVVSGQIYPPDCDPTDDR